MHFLPRALFALLLVLAAAPAAAQRIERPLRVFLDCTSFFCDLDYFVQEVPWVSFVRNRQDADVHVLGTSARTAAGGSSFTFELQGRGTFEGERLTVGTTTSSDATEEDRRTALVEVVRVALVPFAGWTPHAPTVEIEPPAGGAGTSVEEDPWNRWSFELGGDGFLSGESRQSAISVSGYASASRVTDRWKTLFDVSTSTSRSRFELDDTTTFTSRRESFGANVLIVRSLGPHWGVGGLSEWRRSSFANYDASIVTGAAVEYNVFPYTESTRRLLTVLYAVGSRYNDYEKATIFDVRQETLLEQLMVVAYDVTEPWGNVDLFGEVNHYIARLGGGTPWADPQFSAEVGGGLSVRLFRGLSAYAHGSVAMIRNQIQLPAEGLTEEEILTQQRELATNYRHFAGFGLSYTFGSIFTQVVNPRFEWFD